MPFEQIPKSEALKKAEEEDARIAKSLSPEAELDDPRPPTVSEELAQENLEILESRLAEQTEKLGRLIGFPENKKFEKPEGPEKKKAA